MKGRLPRIIGASADGAVIYQWSYVGVLNQQWFFTLNCNLQTWLKSQAAVRQPGCRFVAQYRLPARGGEACGGVDGDESFLDIDAVHGSFHRVSVVTGWGIFTRPCEIVRGIRRFQSVAARRES